MLRNYQWALFSRRCRLNKLFSRASLDVFVFCKLCRCPHQLDSPLCFLKISMVTRFYHFSKISYFSLIFFFSPLWWIHPPIFLSKPVGNIISSCFVLWSKKCVLFVNFLITEDPFKMQLQHTNSLPNFSPGSELLHSRIMQCCRYM